jgi:hypothetical protein
VSGGRSRAAPIHFFDRPHFCGGGGIATVKRRVIKGITKPTEALLVTHERIEVIGPFQLSIDRERWRVMVFNNRGTVVDSYDAYSKQDALALKTDLAKELARPKPMS